LRGAQIAVTGATGFLGRYVVDELLARGAQVVGVVRNPGKVPALAARIELRQADLTERDRLTAALRGTDAVVSNAALLSLSNRDWDAYQRTNIEGTRNVFEAIAAAGVRRVVHVSSVAVYRRPRRALVTEDHPQHSAASPRRPTNLYPVSKALSEQLAWQIARERGLALTTLRPGGIYGAFDTNFMPVFKRLMRPPLSVFPVCLRIPLVYAGDVAAAIALALANDAAVGQAYNIAGEDRTVWAFARAWRAAGGRAPRLMIPIPVPVRRRYDTTRAATDLGWRNRPLVDGLRDTLAREAAG
jgi:nucleoside-diphosphate-sugar epimerase